MESEVQEPFINLTPPAPIATETLTLADIPAFEVRGLDPQNVNGGWASGSSDAEWRQLWTFALTFNGYQYISAIDKSAPPGAEPGVVRATFLARGRLATADLDMLRACLFLEQRTRCKGNPEAERCPPEVAAYLHAAMSAIRSHVARRFSPSTH